MAGILANSASVTMTSGATSADNAVAGFVAGERVTLSTSPAGATYDWALASPSGSTVRAALDDASAATPSFVPDVAGYYTITVTVDTTTAYVLRLAVVAVALGTAQEAIRFTPMARAAVPAPALGAALYADTVAGAALKAPSGVVVPVRPGIVGAALTDADQTLQIAEGAHRAQQTALTSGRSKTLGTTGAAVGHIIEIHRVDGAAFALTVINGGPGAGTLLTMPSGESHSAAFRFDGTNWALWERRKLV